MIKTFSRFAALAAILSGAPQAQAACFATLPAQDLVSPGSLQLAINPTNPPAQYVDNQGRLQGLNVELADEIGKRLCTQVNLVRMDFPGMIPALKAGRLDGLDTGMFWNEERSKILFMVPYGVQALSVVVANDGDSKIKVPDSLAGTAVGVETNSYQQKWITDYNTQLVAKGGKPVTIRAFTTATDVAGALLAGQVDSALLIDSVANALIAKGRVHLAFTGVGANRMSMAFGHKKVAEAVVAALDAMQADGTYAALFAKFGLTPLPAGTAVSIDGPGPQ